MSTSLLFSTSILAVCFVQGLMQIAALLKAKHCNKKANYIMAGLIFLCVVVSFDCYLNFTYSYSKFPHLIRVFTPLYVLFGILTYMYSRMLTEPEFRATKKCLLHFIPLLIIYAIYMPVYFQTAEEKIRYISENHNFIIRKIIMLSIMLSNTYYLVNGYLRLKKYQRKIEDFYSNLSAIKVQWMEQLYKVFMIVHFSVVLFSLVFTNQRFEAIYQVLFYGLFILIFISGYLAIRQVDPLTQVPINQKPKKEPSLNKDIVPDNLKLKVKTQLDKLLNQESIYLESEINLDSLAKAAGFPNYIVSTVINSEYNMTFFELINSFRIQEVCRRLIDGQYKNLKIIAIAEDVGFNSKSSFNAEFKKRIGTTPSAYRSANLQSTTTNLTNEDSK